MHSGRKSSQDSRQLDHASHGQGDAATVEFLVYLTIAAASACKNHLVTRKMAIPASLLLQQKLHCQPNTIEFSID